MSLHFFKQLMYFCVMEERKKIILEYGALKFLC